MKTYQTNRAKIFFGGKADSLDTFEKKIKDAFETTPLSATNKTKNPLIFGHQVHESSLIEVNNSYINKDLISSLCLIDSSDGLYTKEKNLALGLYTADCVPCFVVSHNYIYSLHLGWKGVYFGLLKKCLKKIKENALLSDSKEAENNITEVFIGPHILCSSFEVQTDLIDKFSKVYSDKELWSKTVNNKSYISLIELIKIDLKLSGLEHSLHFEEKDTFLSKDHYSYRSDDKTRLRNLSCAFLRP